MAAVASAIGGCALSSFDTAVLMTVEETVKALRRAQKVTYRPSAVTAAEVGHLGHAG
jgi:hypothetical protein